MSQQQSLPPSSPSHVKSDSSVRQYATYLKAFYQSRQVPVDQKWPPTPSKKYVNLVVVGREPASREEAYKFTTARLHGSIDEILKIKKSITMDNFLKSDDGKDLKCILVEGSPGVGKSTFAWELCRGWGKFETLNKYCLVILIHLRDQRVQNASSLSDLIYHRDSKLREAVVEWIDERHGAYSIFILDGFDELPDEQRSTHSIFSDLIQGLYLPNATIVVTSRPSASAEFLRCYKPQISKHVEILGFTHDNIMDYAESVFGKDTVELNHFTQYIMSNPLIYGMMYVPLNAVIIAIVYQERHSLDERHGAYSIFILDGFDELPDEQRSTHSIFSDLIQGLYLPNATIVVTSRPSASAEFLRCYKPQISKHVEILGFTHDNIMDYAESVFGKDTVELNHFTQYIMSNPLIYGMMYVPLNAVIIAIVYQERHSLDKPIPQTLTQLYETLSFSLLQRHLTANSKPSSIHSSLDDLPSEITSQLQEVATVAFKGICNHQLTFSDLIPSFQHLGFMNKATSLYIDEGTEVSFHFLHLTLQEYLAAHHISQMTKKEQQQLYRKYSSTPHFKIVWRFLAGMTKFTAIGWDILSSYSTSNYTVEKSGMDDVDCWVNTFITWCLFEAQDPQACDFVCQSNKTGYQPDTVTPFDLYALGYCIIHSHSSWALDLRGCNVSSESLQMLALSLHSKPHPRSQIEELHLGGFVNTTENIATVGMKHVTDIPLGMLATLHKLCLSQCNLDRSACNLLATFVQHLPNLAHLFVNENPLGNGGAKNLLQALQQCQNLCTLFLHSCNLGVDDILCLRELLAQKTSLNVLSVGDKNMSPEYLELMLTSVFAPTSLHTLLICDVDLTNAGHFLQSLSQNTNITTLKLFGCKVSKDTVTSITETVANSTSLQHLSTSNCPGMNADTAKTLSGMIANNKSLKKLYLLEQLEITGCIELIQALRHNYTLTTLVLPLQYQKVKTCLPHELLSCLTRVHWKI